MNPLAVNWAEVKGVCFDVYGTLMPSWEHDPYRWLAGQATPARRAFLKEAWMTRPSTWASAVADVGLTDEIAHQEGVRLQALLDHAQPLNGALSALQACREAGFKVSLISNLAQPYSEPLSRLFHEAVDAWVWSWEVGAIKPSAAIYEAAAHRLGLLPSACLMVGDSLRCDIEGARAQGWQAWQVSRTPDDSLHQLTQNVKSLRRSAKLSLS